MPYFKVKCWFFCHLFFCCFFFFSCGFHIAMTQRFLSLALQKLKAASTTVHIEMSERTLSICTGPTNVNEMAHHCPWKVKWKNYVSKYHQAISKLLWTIWTKWNIILLRNIWRPWNEHKPEDNLMREKKESCKYSCSKCVKILVKAKWWKIRLNFIVFYFSEMIK